jgi:hypothetical protein
MWQGPQRVFFWAEDENPKELFGMPRYVVASGGGKIIFTNRPLSGSTRQ